VYKPLYYDKLYDFLEQQINDNPIDLSTYDFVDPVFWAILKCLKNLNSNLKIIFPESFPAKEYVKYLSGKSYSSNTVPMRFVELRSDIDLFTNELVNLLRKDLEGYDSEDMEFFKYIISELLNNAIDHGESSAIVFAQKFRNNDFEIGVIDSGLGFYHTIKRAYNVESEGEAIRKSLEKGITGSKTYLYGGATRNVGHGLYVISEMIKDSKGELIIVSGSTFYSYKDNKEISLKNKWQGSIVLIRFNLQNFKKYVLDFGMSVYLGKTLNDDVVEEDIF